MRSIFTIFGFITLTLLIQIHFGTNFLKTHLQLLLQAVLIKCLPSYTFLVYIEYLRDSIVHFRSQIIICNRYFNFTQRLNVLILFQLLAFYLPSRILFMVEISRSSRMSIDYLFYFDKVDFLLLIFIIQLHFSICLQFTFFCINICFRKALLSSIWVKLAYPV